MSNGVRQFPFSRIDLNELHAELELLTAHAEFGCHGIEETGGKFLVFSLGEQFLTGLPPRPETFILWDESGDSPCDVVGVHPVHSDRS